MKGASAQTTKVIYELQERCGRRAAEVFAKDFPQDPGNNQVLAKYENHYNAQLNKCLMFESSTTFFRDTQGKTQTLNMLTLVDVNENKVLANLDQFQCNVQEKTCKSEGEWRALIKPLMEQ
jgi:hypothetical protein